MATTKAFIRTSKKSGEVPVRFRLSDGRNVQLFHVSEITVIPAHWDSGKQRLKSRVLMNDKVRNETNNAVAARKALLLNVYAELKGDISKWDEAIDRKINPSRYKRDAETFFEIFDEFIKAQPDRQEARLMVLRRCLQRWELFLQTEDRAFRLDLNNITAVDVGDFDDFLSAEHALQNDNDYKFIYDLVPERKIPPRGDNARSNMLNLFRTFFKWALSKYTTNYPFSEFKVRQCVYGTPIYIDVAERNKLLDTDLSDNKELETQRDIFAFQCLIGCRVSDLHRLTTLNVKGDFLEYVASKTKNDPKTIRVPLTQTAKNLIMKYEGADSKGRLFPFVSDQKYNKLIKRAFSEAGLNRLVTVLNPTTGDEEQRPLSEVASSHMARRTFVGNLYKKVRDPNLIGSMSGHVPGSKAFARYRAIDDDIKTEVIKYLE